MGAGAMTTEGFFGGSFFPQIDQVDVASGDIQEVMALKNDNGNY